MCCMLVGVRCRVVAVLVAALCVVGISTWAQDVRRAGGKGQDSRVREGVSAPQGPPSINNATLKGMNPNGSFIIQDGDVTGVVAVDRTTEIIIRGEADQSFVSPGCLVEVSGTLEGPRGPLVTNFVVVLRSMAKNLAANQRLQPYINLNPPKPGEARSMTASIRGQVVSANPLVISATNQKMPIRVDDKAHYLLEIVGGDPRSLCKDGDKVDVTFQPSQGRNVPAQTIIITRAEPFNAALDKDLGKDAKKKDDPAPEKGKKAVKGKAALPNASK